MLGLMGTLIPMGPALVGLSTGDIASMAYNMQVAFATTVVAVSYTHLVVVLEGDRSLLAAVGGESGWRTTLGRDDVNIQAALSLIHIYIQ